MPLSFSECSFHYRRGKPVLQELSCVLPPGRTVLLGPNGAGKSTLLGLGASALMPRSGSVAYGVLFGSSRRTRAEYRRRVAWMPQQVGRVPGLTAREQVAYTGWLKGLTRHRAWREALRALRRVELADRADERVDQLSGGQQRRVGVAQALVHDAEVLLLDEPTAGMDPRQRQVFHEILAGLSESVHLVLSTHDTADLANTYESVVLLLDSKVRFTGTVTDFLSHAEMSAVSDEQRAISAYQVLTTGFEELLC
jgi:ABC-type multidrug transport system ATPase subunit